MIDKCESNCRGESGCSTFMMLVAILIFIIGITQKIDRIEAKLNEPKAVEVVK